MTFTVKVQIWGPYEGTCNYTWITIDKIVSPKSLDLEYLKKEVLKRINKMEHRPNTNIARLEFVTKGKTVMKAIYLDLW